MMLRESGDQEISGKPPDVNTARKWKAEDATDEHISSLEHGDIVGPAQSDRSGLGNGDFRPFRKMSQRDRRKAAAGQVRKMEAEKREVHLIQCAQQGQVTAWEEHVVERKIGWSDIWNWTTSRLSFLLRSTYDVLPSPVNLVRWKVQEDDMCRCGKRGTMKHILSNCHLALNRYTWRHNEVLKVFTNMAKEQVEEGRYAPRQQGHGQSNTEFVRQGDKVPDRKKASEATEGQSGGQWEVAADLEDCKKFFPIPTTKKPDLVIWSEEEKEVHLVELTVPHEDNIGAAHERKEERYETLVEGCEEAGWKATHFPVEVGCRGFIATSVRRWMRVAGIGPKKGSAMTKALQETAEKASHWIWLKREDTSWNDG